MNFVERCVKGEKLELQKAVDEYVQKCLEVHAPAIPISEYLGFTYAEWLTLDQHRFILPAIICARRLGRPPSEILEQAGLYAEVFGDEPLRWFRALGDYLLNCKKVP